MIIIKLIGGLGNQLFQYAIGRQLSIKHGVKLKVDLVELLDRKPRQNFTFRDFELGDFKFQVQSATKFELLAFKLKTWVLTKIGLRKSYFRESKFTFDSNLLMNSSNSMYLNGFWQTEKYFTNIRSVLINDLNLLNELSIVAKKWESQINSANAISIHIRRGDYISNSLANEFHGFCSLEYYISAIEFIKGKIGNCVFFFFSDDLEWAKTTFSSLEDVAFVESISNKEDLYLMSICRHNIIANSSFSWWGAWLNQNQDKIVIAPKKWFNDESIDTTDLIPSTWIRI